MEEPINATQQTPLSHYDAIADKLETQPELLAIPLANIARWLAQDHSAPHRLEQWRTLILQAQASAAGMEKLLAILRDRGEKATHLRSFDVFPGILTLGERRRIIAQCAFSH